MSLLRGRNCSHCKECRFCGEWLTDKPASAPNAPKPANNAGQTSTFSQATVVTVNQALTSVSNPVQSRQPSPAPAAQKNFFQAYFLDSFLRQYAKFSGYSSRK